MIRNSLCTDYKITNVFDSWTFKNFSLCKFPTKSPYFETQGMIWSYLLDPEKATTHGKCIYLELEVIQSAGPKQLSIKTNVHNAQESKKFKRNFKLVKQGSKVVCLCESRKALFSANEITFSFEITIVEEHTYKHDMNIVELPSKLTENLAEFLGDKEYSDVKIVVCEKEFHAHKGILSVRSPVFKAMFKNEMVESDQNQVTIIDIKPEVFAELLRYIYTDSVQGLDQMALELLQAADKYDLARLKTMCEKALCANISGNSAIKILLTADLHQAGQLKQAAIQFMEKNAGILNSEEWKNLWTTNFDLANQTMSEILKLRN